MRHVLSFASVLALGVLGCGGGHISGPCDGPNPDPACALECDAANPCPDGFYCDTDGTCTADCSLDGTGCAPGQHCNLDGQCEANVDADCPNVTLTGERTTPTVQLLLDQSGSMDQNFGGVSRYTAMRNALVGTDGVVTATQGSVFFGASLYTWASDPGTETCPRITSTADRKLNNLNQIKALLDGNTYIQETPTGESIDKIVDAFIASPPPAGSPPIILLATDGEPDTCAVPNPQNGQETAIAAAERAYMNGIRLYILGVSSDVGAPHLQDMANAGVGNDPAVTGQDAPYYQADDPTELSQALEQLVGGVLSCELQLDGVVDPQAASSGVVTLNGEELDLGTDWEIVDGDTIRLLGDACDLLLSSSNPVVTATFSCGVVVE